MLLLAQTDSAMHLLRRALRAAPDDPVIHLTYIQRRWEDGEFRSTAAEYRARRDGHPDVRECLAAVTDFTFAPGYDGPAIVRARARLQALRSRPAARTCAELMQLFLDVRAMNPLLWDLALFARLERARALAPHAPTLWLDGLNVLRRADARQVQGYCAAGRAALLDVLARFTFDTPFAVSCRHPRR